MENVERINENKSKRTRNILITLFIVTPLLVLSLLYVNNKTFKNKADALLSKLPGVVGEYFKNMPTEEERKMMKSELANYYLSLDPSVTADKLYIIKKEDEKLYQDIVKLMNSISPSQTAEIIELVRKIDLRRDLLVSIYDEIQSDKEAIIMQDVEKFQSGNLFEIIEEIETRFSREKDFKENLSTIFTLIDEDQGTNILYYINNSIRQEILYSLNPYKRNSIENKLAAKRRRISQLEELSELYRSKPIDIAIEEIGNTEEYSIEELAIIYKNMPILKISEILTKIDDEEFVQDLITAIKLEEQLLKEDTITNEIGRSMDFVKEYDYKINNLVSIYEDMRVDKVAKIIEKMLNNDDTVTVLEIQAEPVFRISDASIAIDILSKMKNKTLAKIIDNMNDRRAAVLTQELAKPIIRSDEVLIAQEEDIENADKEYSKKIDDLVSVYESMQPKKAADIAENMMKNENTATIIVDIFSKLQDRNLSNIMNQMKVDVASKLTEMLAR